MPEAGKGASPSVRRPARGRAAAVGVASLLEGALRDHLLEAAMFFAVIEVFLAVVQGDGARLVVGVVTGVVGFAFTGWVIWRKLGAGRQYLTALTVFAALSGATILVLG